MSLMSKKENSNLSTSLVNSIGQANLSEAAAEAGDVILDSLLEDGVLKDVPVFGWLLKAYNAGQSISDRLFMRKVAAFLYGVGDAPAEKREEFQRKIAEDEKYERKVGENLLLLIDRHERLEKSALLGRLFASHVKGDLPHDLFLRLAAALDRAITEDLQGLQRSGMYDEHKGYYLLHMLDEHVKEGLNKCGLVDIESHLETREIERSLERNYSGVRTHVDYRLSDLGKLFVEHAFQMPSKY